MPLFEECLDLFQLPETYSLEQLKKAYYAQAQLWHPDRFVDPVERAHAIDEFQRLTESYAFLQKLLDERRKSEEMFMSVKQSFSPGKAPVPDVNRFTPQELNQGNSLGLLFKLFGLDPMAFSLLVSFQNAMFEEDLANKYMPIWTYPEHSEGDPDEKRLWHISWQDSIRAVCLSCDAKRRPSLLVDRSKEYQEGIKSLQTPSSPFATGLIALELAAFDLYWPLPENPLQRFQWFSIDRVVHSQFMDHVFKPLNLTGEFVLAIRDDLEATMRRLHGNWKALHTEVFPRGDGTLFGAALSAKRDFSLTPRGLRPKDSHVSPEAFAFAGAGLRPWVPSDPKCLIVGGGGALFSPVCGDGKAFTGLWSLTEVLLALAKIEVFLKRVVRKDQKYSFLAPYITELFGRLETHLAKIRISLPDHQKDKLDLVRSWAKQVAPSVEKELPGPTETGK